MNPPKLILASGSPRRKMLLHMAGFDIAIADDVFVHHHLSASFDQLKEEERDALFERNKKIFEKKWGAWKPHQYREEG